MLPLPQHVSWVCLSVLSSAWSQSTRSQVWLLGSQGLDHGFVLEYSVSRSEIDRAELAVSLEASGSWFGGCHLMTQLWPLNRASLEVRPRICPNPTPQPLEVPAPGGTSGPAAPSGHGSPATHRNQ
jgi:hypothetical protein